MKRNMQSQSRLKPYQTAPTHVLSSAFQLFRSSRIQTALVEGTTDKKFLSQWSKPSRIKYQALEGKEYVEEAYKASKKPPYNKAEFLFFFADIDYDLISKKSLVTDQRFIYNAYCEQKKSAEFNDLESFLINTSAFEKLLANLEIDTSEAEPLRKKLELASRLVGALRAADHIVTQKNRLTKSILNGLRVDAYFDSQSLTIKLEELYEQLPRWSNYPDYVEELIDTAEQINACTPKPWALSRGHDLTEMLSLHFKQAKRWHKDPAEVELLLRLACDYQVFKDSAMGRKLMAGNFDDFLPS